jgi:hypothetical protein
VASAHHFAVPDAIEPILSHYTGEGFDFLAVRLRPGQGVRAMQPIRVVMPAREVRFRLRMVAAGIGAKVGLTLFVVSEGRYHTKNFPDAKLDRDALAWDVTASKSNYRDFMDDALAKTGGRGLGRASTRGQAVHGSRHDRGRRSPVARRSNTGQQLDDLYRSTCGRLPKQSVA